MKTVDFLEDLKDYAIKVSYKYHLDPDDDSFDENNGIGIEDIMNFRIEIEDGKYVVNQYSGDEYIDLLYDEKSLFSEEFRKFSLYHDKMGFANKIANRGASDAIPGTLKVWIEEI